ncbi:hypothetical protein SNOG_20009 [Parastagonospora nodorum SN15]|uniref:Uncharacterized protein n=1 Tax=Phaeosphaeria nodorum (strain SN15 / ATCC MYA-4574 / FGSC 10173) TaxID=321614 RepID=A9JU03_PHANO|nr:hypothetical protein SNOG_20009 [Parastagonospora nodorum SN15]EDP89759.1 hypothetical protein SNOG_20009 [Parastagonospora nodorum SN15]
MMEAKNTMTAMATPAIAPLDNAGEEEMADVEDEGVDMDVARGVALGVDTGPAEAEDGDGDGDGEGEGDSKFSTTLSMSSLSG